MCRGRHDYMLGRAITRAHKTVRNRHDSICHQAGGVAGSVKSLRRTKHSSAMLDSGGVVLR